MLDRFVQVDSAIFLPATIVVNRIIDFLLREGLSFVLYLSGATGHPSVSTNSTCLISRNEKRAHRHITLFDRCRGFLPLPPPVYR